MNSKRNFYYKLRTIYERYKTLESVKSDFNIFNIISNPYDEVNLHSIFIFSLLANKHYGKNFLVEFLKRLDVEILDVNEIESFYIEREKFTNRGRIDLFISYTYIGKEYIIALENKIWAEDQYEQLDRYYDFCRNYFNVTNQNIKVAYLTLFGDDPSEESCSENLLEIINIISYKNDIVEWIDGCIKIVALEPKLREVLFQYKELIIDITGGKTDFTMDIKKMILEDYDNFVIASEVENSLIEARIELQLTFWEELERQLNSLVDKGILIAVTDAKSNGVGKFNCWYDKERVKKFYTISKGYKYYGLLYLIKEVEDVGKLYLKVEIDSRDVYFGIRRQISPINDSSTKCDALKEKLKIKNFLSVYNNEWWLGSKYFEYNNQKLEFRNINKDLAKALYKEDSNTLVESCTNQIMELISIINEFDI